MLNYKYYKFPDETFCPSPDEWPEGVSIDVVGLIVEQEAMFDEDGEELTPTIYKEGWHVNIVYQGTPDLSFVEKFEIQVDTPIRYWFGQPI